MVVGLEGLEDRVRGTALLLLLMSAYYQESIEWIWKDLCGMVTAV